jgi:DNA-binding transcriptional regulator YiaG
MTALELRAILTDIGLSQRDFARALGVDERTVRYWIAGQRRIPADAVRVIRLAGKRGYWNPREPIAAGG